MNLSWSKSWLEKGATSPTHALYLRKWRMQQLQVLILRSSLFASFLSSTRTAFHHHLRGRFYLYLSHGPLHHLDYHDTDDPYPFSTSRSKFSDPGSFFWSYPLANLPHDPISSLYSGDDGCPQSKHRFSMGRSDRGRVFGRQSRTRIFDDLWFSSI
jgi:hypothetical protein